MKHQQNDLTHALRRPVELAPQSGRRGVLTLSETDWLKCAPRQRIVLCNDGTLYIVFFITHKGPSAADS